MHTFQQLGRKLWQDDYGTVISAELLCIAVVVLIGLIAGFTSLRDAAIAELSDVAGSVQDVAQHYTFNSIEGHASGTAGSSFADATDQCDQPGDPAGAADNCIVFDLGPSSESPILGDLNLDGAVDFLDIGPFLTALFSGAPEADIDQNGVVDFLDISAFILILTS